MMIIPYARLNVLAKPWPDVADELCRDEIYMQDQPCPRAEHLQINVKNAANLLVLVELWVTT